MMCPSCNQRESGMMQIAYCRKEKEVCSFVGTYNECSGVVEIEEGGCDNRRDGVKCPECGHMEEVK